MDKNSKTFSLNNFTEFRIQMLNWANQFNIFCLLDNQQYNFTTPAFECLLAVGCKKNISINSGTAFTTLQSFYAQNKGWLFGHLGYDLKNETEKLQSQKFDGIGFNDMHFFVPEVVIKLSANQVEIFTDNDAEKIFATIQMASTIVIQKKQAAIVVKNSVAKKEYIDTIHKLQQHILRGDCYEINFSLILAYEKELGYITPTPYYSFKYFIYLSFL